MNDYINLYGGNPTAGKKNGSIISENGTFTSPLVVLLNASEEETVAKKVALRCEKGYQTYGKTTIRPQYLDPVTNTYKDSGGNINNIKVALDYGYQSEAIALQNARWSNQIEIEDVIKDVNKVFWVRIAATKDEKPGRDENTSLGVYGTIEEASEE